MQVIDMAHPLIGELDLFLFGKGVHYKLYEWLGGRLVTHQGVAGARFIVWAPSADWVSLTANFNDWNPYSHGLHRVGVSGLWALFIPGVQEGESYKFVIHRNGRMTYKADPCALYAEVRPCSASILFNVDQFVWTDDAWMQKRKEFHGQPFPFNAYEVHLGSWKRGSEGFLSYQDLGNDLGAYCQKMGYSHIELLPVMEHPLDESWGYQVTGFFAATSRFGNPAGFQSFVNTLHAYGIGVIMDWVPAHFPSDEHALASFDGSQLYEHADPKQGFHPHWQTHIFNYGRFEVSNFLIASALFWFDKMHIDGLRVDAVSSMLYLDYGRPDGEWIPNAFGGKENLEAIEFLKHLNAVVHEHFPGVLMIAEESTAFFAVSHSLNAGGLGFDMKWNMGWMHDTLRYLSHPSIARCYYQNDLTFSLMYAFSENFTLPLSHDEVVHGKNSLLSKMPGDDWQKFAQMRLLFGYQLCHPGKSLLFMGADLGQWHEWSCLESLPWHLLEYERHQQLNLCCRELNLFYRNNPALWEKDFCHTGFEWVDFSDRKNSVISYFRKGSEQWLFCIHNFTPATFLHYEIVLPGVYFLEEAINTDSCIYGGSGLGNAQSLTTDETGRLVLVLPL